MAWITCNIREIEDCTGVQLPRGQGCPYFAHELSMPDPEPLQLGPHVTKPHTLNPSRATVYGLPLPRDASSHIDAEIEADRLRGQVVDRIA